MWRLLTRAALAACLLAAVSASAAAGPAIDVIEAIRLGALDLKARHVRPEAAGFRTFLIVHDTLGSYQDPLVERLQSALAEQGDASLAINLSLAVGGREAPLDCNARHEHRHEDAIKEIAAWTDWLLGEGLGPVILAGVGRGGAQSAWSLSAGVGRKVAAAVLLAPLGWSPAEADAEYRARYQNGLAALLTRIAGLEPDTIVENVPFLHCGAVAATKGSIVSYYGVEPKRDTPTVLANVTTPTLALLPDHGVTEPTAKRFAQIKNPNVVVRTIADADAQFAGETFQSAMQAIDAYIRSVLPAE